MDVLKDKSYGEYNYTSRYASVPYYYHTLDEKYIDGLGSNLYKNTYYTLHNVTEKDTLDSLALKYYNNPTYYWVIAYFNDIQDCFINLSEYFTSIKIPHISSIKFGDEK